MLLAIDVGNTNIVLGLFDGDVLTVSWRLASRSYRTSDELWVLVSRLFDDRQIDTGRITGVIASSVVPSLTQTVTDMVSHGLACEIVHVDATNSGLPIRYDNPEEVGADRIVNGVAVRTLYGASSRPVIVLDFGTATTFDAISSAGEYLGGIICPGVEISADALFQRAARLPRVDVRRPDSLIGRTTVASMRSGLFYGYVAMVEGIVSRMRQDLQSDGSAVSVATGGLAAAIADETEAIDHVNPDLTLIGLRLVWERNHQANVEPRP